MAFSCPHCGHSMNVKAPKPGRYSPKCPKCAQTFSLIIPTDVTIDWIVTKTPPATKTVIGGSASPAPSSETTGAFDGLPAPPVSPPPGSVKKTVIGGSANPPAPSPEVTGAFGTVDPNDQTMAEPGNALSPALDQTMAEGEVPPVAPSSGEIRTKLPTRKAAKTVVDSPNSDETMATAAPPDEQPRSRKRKTDSQDDLDLPDVMGGYQIVKQLGKGGMGAVYLARQVSLDRPVALKVMNARWAEDPVFVARFAREAYAAAQLVHHNIIQIYDIGEHDGVHFFSMEFVEGQSLADLVRQEGKLDPELAVGYILQAARGLKFAHDRGMIHRDIKPDNLMLNTHGIVKVADLGLVKTPDMTKLDDQISANSLSDDDRSRSASRTGLGSLPTNVTNVNVAMGTPAYMSPEQCRDAANVDARADIYSLGCTLYVMLTGRPPFQGTTAFEVMSKHATEQVVPPDEIVKRVPKKISDVLIRMMAKERDQRHQDMGELIKELEVWLGIHGTGPFTPREEHIETLESVVSRFVDHPKAKLKHRLIQGYFGIVGVAMVGCLLFGAAPIAGGMLGLLLSSTASYFVFHGLGEKGYFFRKVRQLIFGSSMGDWLTAIAGGIVFLMILWLTGQLWYWIPFGVLGVALGFGLYSLIDRPLASDRQKMCDDLEDMFKRMRIQGLEEESLRLFVGKYSGRKWEALYEALFGYESKLTMRGLLQRGDGGKVGDKFAAWRDPLIGYVDALQIQRKEASERRHLQKLEQKMLEAKGVDKATAREQAEAAADIMVAQAGELKAANRTLARQETQALPAVNVKTMLKAVDAPAKKLPKPPRRPVASVVNFAFSGKLRFLIAAVLLAGGALWAKQNVTAINAGITQYNLLAKENGRPLVALYELPMALLTPTPPFAKPLDIGFQTALFEHANPLIAGVILLVSLFFASVIGRVVISAGALIAFVGHLLFVPSFGAVPAYQVAILLGVAVMLVGMALSPPKRT